jgi:beta-lactamase regulating signal transducer with metallopeptidase domain
MSVTHFHQAIGWIAERLLNGVPDGVVVAFVTWLFLRLLGRKNSSTRFAVWCLALLTILVLPLVSGLTARYSESHRIEPSAIGVPISWARDLVLVWIAMALAGLCRVAMGLWSLRTLRGDPRAIDPQSLDPGLERTLREFQPIRKVSLGVSAQVSVPAAIGFFKPMILLPAWALSELSPEELNSIVIHELAHLGRRDDWTNLGQQIIRALLFFHPAVWWIDHQLSLEREMACDDHVLSRMENPRTYAECLLAVAEKSLLRRGLGLAQAAVRGMRQTSRRVAQILAANHPRTLRVWKPAVGLVAAIAALGAVWLSQAPELVAVREPMTIAAVSVPGRSAPPRSGTTKPRENVVLARLEGGLEPPAHVAAAENRISRRSATHESEAGLLPPTFAAQLWPATWVAGQGPIETLVVVARTEPYHGAGSWTVCVWRFSLVAPAASRPRVPARSI